ncbi:hypothetical protein K488DRAFT_70142 [Vararia minispora EC-137]|uniref:Uncharacterized protein n=1 Tax=Vararia minispora EC-137 TaxID=1314806 RepID=A0ACB8QMM1_9AGAM|nr:hypothetical protein K488DRAFT_70142 [Vararia minispora EC-137]
MATDPRVSDMTHRDEASAFKRSGGEEIQVSISRIFNPGNSLDAAPPDVKIESSDGVLFYVHAHRLLALSNNHFNSMLVNVPVSTTLQVPESSAAANILMHTIYGLPSGHFRPGALDVIAAVDAMQTYGLSLQTFLAQGTPTYSLVLSVAPSCPLECYILAAKYRLEDLAVAVSTYTLLINLSTVTDTISMRIGPIYLKRLFFLHLGRFEALKRILRALPEAHPPRPDCGVFESQHLQNAWTLAVGSLTWEPNPGLSNGEINTTLLPLGEHLTCMECKATLLERIHQILVQWSLVKRTI